jgi:hypothetical protein
MRPHASGSVQRGRVERISYTVMPAGHASAAKVPL